MYGIQRSALLQCTVDGTRKSFMEEREGTGRCFGEEIGGTSIRTLWIKERALVRTSEVRKGR